MRVNDQPTLGDWRFDIESAVLTQPGRTKRLENRSALTLELLCRRRGEVVSKAAILGEVWRGRAVSDNSVAIVIADLRRALGEDSRAPVHIETVAKRGYRLNLGLETASAPSSPANERRGARPFWALGAVAVAALVAATISTFEPPHPLTLVFAPVFGPACSIPPRLCECSND